MRRGVLLGVIVAGGALSLTVAAHSLPPQPQRPKVIEVDKVDAKNPRWGQPILDTIKELTPKPVTTLINTHPHGDHVSGNVEFPATVEVITQENTKTNMEKMDIFKQNNGKGMPKRTF